MVDQSRSPRSLDPIQGLWIGSDLSVMERLSISSFLANGHPVHLYVYGDVGNVPAGTTLCDGNEILPEKSIFQYRDNGSYSGFANYFRYDLLLKRGGWWVDLDTVCLRPFLLNASCVISSERMPTGSIHPNCGVLKAPPGSDLMAYLSACCHSRDTGRIVWGETGPKLMAEAVTRFGLETCVQPPEVFCPINWPDWQCLFDPDGEVSFTAGTLAVHLWNEVWRRNVRDKDARYDHRCLYERLKARYI